MEKYLTDFKERFPEMAYLDDKILQAAVMIVEAMAAGHTLFTCGNGGSGSDSDHIVGELLKGFKSLRPLSPEFKKKFDVYGEAGKEIANKLQYGLRAISLTSHPAFTTAFLNDVDGTLIFAQQLFALGREGDVVIGISTSGNAENVKACFMTARTMGVKTILLTGKDGGACAKLVDCEIRVPEYETYKIQEMHLPIYHTLCLMIEDHFYGE
ncbi:MAG: SIS domain-containing protein [Lentisphaerae bacterium]|nr:SIS domain-containing protein [Lentisphaerota bacterium]MCP4100419.1 SIS domain-containing protein [Lentisphaerota bacterium]